MITFKNLAKAIALAALLALVAPQAAFAGGVLCSPPAASAANGARRIGGTNSGAPSLSGYTLNAQGCAWIPQQDYAWGLSQGMSPGNNTFSVSFTGLAAQSTTSNSPIIPAFAVINEIVVQETAGQAVTGGLDIGIAGSSDATIVSAFAVPASSILNIPSASILRRVFGAAGATTGTPSAQQIFFNAHTNWTDGATINATIVYSLYGPF
jgi:hypothetical protein